MLEYEPEPNGSTHTPAPRVHRPRGPLPALARLLGSRPWLMRLARVIIAIENVLRGSTGNRWSLVGMAGLSSVQVTTPGRRTAIPRTTALLAVPFGDGFIVTGSNWGRRRHPAWEFNLAAADSANVRIGARTVTMTIHEVTDDERPRFWADVVHYWPGYDTEQRMVPDRRFTMFLLRPVRPGAARPGRRDRASHDDGRRPA